MEWHRKHQLSSIEGDAVVIEMDGDASTDEMTVEVERLMIG